MSTFEDHARTILDSDPNKDKIVCLSCGHSLSDGDDVEQETKICYACWFVDDNDKFHRPIDGHTYCTCEDRPCCGCA